MTSELWEGLDGASDWPVGEIMSTWVYQRGFPQIDVKRVSGGIELGQRRYFAIPDASDTTVWKIPIHLRGSANGENFEMRVLAEDDETFISIDGEIDWIVANGGGKRFLPNPLFRRALHQGSGTHHRTRGYRALHIGRRHAGVHAKWPIAIVRLPRPRGRVR